ncbi:TolC family protein [Leeuwenhoekiella blandensis]|uniref:Metal ion efflux outer membrane protein family protein, putative n=1 Tax=Leeuwenhoekiella blandensis (strain CECT 7118 / CCUG 51940 / KCTC 22103 / MED217) TaxID=398720 RepID=A3XMT3_LEEBM|nr:TolC family protein [Leeuwenhoekiella blandensis]EAQ49144.1 metal ion efflux outer membrane protein family protein, putative [Leeuwenhoekiella blandensis MED217]
MNKRFNIATAIVLGFTAVATAQDLSGYIAEVETNNPEVQAYELRYSIAQEKVNEVNTLPDTEFGVGYFVSTPETRVGAQRARFSVKQMLPWFGTISKREKYQDALVETEYLEYVIAKRKLGLAVAQGYYKLYTIEAQSKVVQQNVELLERYKELALNAVEVAKASVVDVLKLEMRQNELKAQQQILEERRIAAEIQFKNTLNTASEGRILVVDSLSIPIEDEQINSEDLSANPELLKYDKLYESVTQAEILNRQEAAPKWGVGLDYIPVSERTDMFPADNGKDIVMPMVSVSVPIFNSKYKSVSRQNELRQQELDAQKAQRLNTLKNLLAEAKQHKNTARINFNTQKQNIAQAQDAEEILLKSYETGSIDFNDVLDIQELQLEFQLKQLQAVQNYYEQAALINYLTNI